jgi:fibronectin type 3 domain-containing protein
VKPAYRAVAALAGVSAFATLTPAALADPAPGQDINNDWGQTASQVAAEISGQVEADPRVVAARNRYQLALSRYADVTRAVSVANVAYHRALATPSKVDDAAALKTLLALKAQEYPAACEVVASQLALTRTLAAVTAQVRSLHYIQAPYVAKPVQPAGVTAVGQAGQVSLTWTPVDGATQYRVFRNGAEVGRVVVPAFIDTGLDNGATYAYTVMAVNVAGWSPLSAEVDATPNVAPPDVPGGVVATPGDTQVALSWNPSTNATSYDVYRDGVLVASPSTPGCTDTGLTDGTSYSYTVVALNGTVPSSASTAVAATPVATAPAAPTGLIAAPGNTQIGLSWTAVNGATLYRVFRNGTSVGTTGSPAYTDTGLTNGTSYSYYVVAYRLNSPASAASATVASSPVTPPLSTPTGVSATPGDTQVSLTWNAVSAATSYKVLRNGSQVAAPAGTSYTDTGLTNGTTYSYTVVAVSASSSSTASAPVTATPAAAAPGAPTGLSGQAGDTAATLTWTAVSGATSYKVYRGGVLKATVTSPSYSDTGLTNGTTYSYYVTAVKSGVESAASTTVTVTPVAVTPGVPSGVVAAPGNAQVTVSWTASANAQSYKVYRNGTLVGSPATTSFTDTGLTNGTTYSYTVVAVNGSASSAASAAVTGTPMAPAPAAPTGLSATAGNTQVALSWTAPANATSYQVYRNGALIASPTATSYTDTGLTNSTTYSYYVKAVNQTTPSAASSTITATPAKPPVNGTFVGTTTAIANGHGTLNVTIVITNNVITSASGTLLTNDGSTTRSINNNAIPQYNSKTVAANSANITKVSGATLTFNAYKTSLQSALTQAGL